MIKSWDFFEWTWRIHEKFVIDFNQVTNYTCNVIIWNWNCKLGVDLLINIYFESINKKFRRIWWMNKNKQLGILEKLVIVEN